MSASDELSPPCPGGQQAEREGTLMTNCGECARLERVREQARAKRDYSTVTDCDVLLKRHPNHPAHRQPQESRPREVRS